jgi:putative membrane protein insertion efficiency factor
MRLVMPWISRRRYDPYYDPYYDRRARYQQSSCLRDACLLETGCCVAEGLDGNCLMLALPLLPRLFLATAAGRGSGGRLLGGIRFYQREISAHRPAVCRFTPSCSEYAAQAVQRRGAWRGTLLAARRLLRCRPGGARGADPVPAAA